jgi:hypothetical protein
LADRRSNSSNKKFGLNHIRNFFLEGCYGFKNDSFHFSVCSIVRTIPAVETGYTPSLQIVTLKVYDILGKVVKTLVNEQKSAGTYELEFHAEIFQAGFISINLKMEIYQRQRS